jgi:hypothetical protein
MDAGDKAVPKHAHDELKYHQFIGNMCNTIM